MTRSLFPSLLTAVWSVLPLVATGLLLLSMQPLQAQEVTTDRWHAIEEGCPGGGALEVRPVAVLGSSNTVEAWKVELRIPEGAKCALPQPRRLRLVIDGRAAPSPFVPADGEEADGEKRVHIVLADTTARRLAEADEVRIVEQAIQADLPQVFRIDAQRVMDKASSLARQAEGEQSERTGAAGEKTSPSSPDASAESDDSGGDDRVYTVVEEQPRLVGGRARVQEAIQYPEEAVRRGLEGRVFVRFVVNKEGRAQDLEVVRGVHELLNAEALRAIREMSFEPGRQDGEPVNTQMTLSVPFRLPDGG